jgi:hypothetical protein
MTEFGASQARNLDALSFVIWAPLSGQQTIPW